jgi:hypothetical protein
VCVLSITEDGEGYVATWLPCDAIEGEHPKERDCHSGKRTPSKILGQQAKLFMIVATLVSTRNTQLRLYILGGCDADFNYMGDLHILNLGSCGSWFLRRSCC